MHMANKQYQRNSHKWKTWQLGLQTLERYWASFQVSTLIHSATNFFNQADYLNEEFFIYFILFFFIFFFFFGGGGGAQLQCIYYLVLYTDLKAAEGN